jgi:hypothetical protein
MTMFDYLLTAERNDAVSAIYKALLCLFEAKGGSHVRAGIPDRLSNESRIVEELSKRIITDITAAERQDLASIPADVVGKYTAALTTVASSRYTATPDVRSEAIRFLKEIDPANSEHGLALSRG